MENSELDFDDLIQSKLVRIAEEVSSDGWLAMSQKLDVDMPRTEDQIFDAILRSKVTEVETTIAGNWSAIHSDLDEIKSLDDQRKFDKIIHNKVSYLDYSRGANWAKLLGQLEEWELIHRQLITSRIVEAFAIIVILMAGYGGFQFSSNSPVERQPIQMQNNESINDAATAQVEPIEQISQELNEPLIATVEEIVADDNLITALAAHNFPVVGHVSNSDLNEGILADVSSAHVQHVGQSHKALAEESIKPNPFNRAINPASINNSNTIAASRTRSSTAVSASPPISENNKKGLSLLEHKMYSLSSWSELNIKETTPVIALLNTPAFADGWSVGLNVSLDQHYIATPYDTDFNLSALERFSRGYGGSVRFNKKFGLWNIESGVAYHYINYQPKEFSIIDGGSFNNGYELVTHSTTELHFVEIPLEFQHNVATSKRLRFYGNLGVSANINVASKYIFKRTSQDNINQRPTPPRTLSRAPQSLSAQKDYSSGALQGGSVSDNSYFTANVGFGLDYHLSDAMDVFFQSTYHHRIGQSAIGPNDDLFHLTSFNFGARFPLKNK